MFDDFFARKDLRKLIKTAGERLYSESSDVDAAVMELSKSGEDIALMRSYICIQTAAQLNEPVKNGDLQAALELLRASEKHLDQAEFAEILDIHRALAELLWMTKRTAPPEGSEETQARISGLQQRLDSLLEGV